MSRSVRSFWIGFAAVSLLAGSLAAQGRQPETDWPAKIVTLEEAFAEREARGVGSYQFFKSKNANIKVHDQGHADVQYTKAGVPHDRDRFVLVLEGEARASVNTKNFIPQTVKSGSMIFVPKGRILRIGDVQEPVKVLIVDVAPEDSTGQ